MTQLSSFTLQDAAGTERRFPTGRPTLVCFVKEDCPTCNLVMPVLDAFHNAWGDTVDILVLGQTKDGNAILAERHGLSVPILDESACKVSFENDIETVPTLLWTDGAGVQKHHVIGFAREEWEALEVQIQQELSVSNAGVAWGDLPEWRPGCGSKSVDPVMADRLRAEADNSPIRARKIEIAEADDEFEFMFDQGFSDGLPLVPPTPERVLRMLDGTKRGPQEVIAIMPPNMGEVTVEKVAINAVMAGCKPEYMPVIIAAVEAVCTDEFNIHGVNATTMGAAPVMIINGPIRHKLDMNMKLGALGNGNRANATIGRALRLVVRNVGGAKPGGTDRSTLGNPMKFTMCFAEWEERNPWEPLHVERGFNIDDNVVTIFAMSSGPTLIVDQESRKPDQMAGTLGLGLEGVWHPKYHGYPIDTILVVCPEHVDTLMVDGDYTKKRLRERIQEVTKRPLRDMVGNEVSGAGLKPEAAAQMSEEQLNALVPKYLSEDYIHIVVAGSDAGKFSGAFHGWATGEMGSISVSRKIGD